MINVNVSQQAIYGFGAANIIDWIGDLTSSQRTTAFSPTDGIGLSIVRTRVSVDSSEFDQAKATVDARKSYEGSAIATAWSTPASMKTNNSIIGGTIKTSSYNPLPILYKNERLDVIIYSFQLYQYVMTK
ncbi:MAG: hypothetical protein ABI113_20005, partial [Mucilaginibacter sp.]